MPEPAQLLEELLLGTVRAIFYLTEFSITVPCKPEPPRKNPPQNVQSDP